MATSTANLGLIKPSGTDKIRIAQINQNMDIIDSAIGAAASGTSLQAQISSNTQAIANTQSGLAYIVGNTNTTGNTLAVGQFVYVKGHSTITEGLRTVTASISANGNITTSNTSACSEGGLNALNSKITNQDKNTATLIGKWTNGTSNLYRLVVETPLDTTWEINTEKVIATISTGLNVKRIYGIGKASDGTTQGEGSKFSCIYIPSNGTINAYQNISNYGVECIITIEYVA